MVIKHIASVVLATTTLDLKTLKKLMDYRGSRPTPIMVTKPLTGFRNSGGKLSKALADPGIYYVITGLDHSFFNQPEFTKKFGGDENGFVGIAKDASEGSSEYVWLDVGLVLSGAILVAKPQRPRDPVTPKILEQFKVAYGEWLKKNYPKGTDPKRLPASFYAMMDDVDATILSKLGVNLYAYEDYASSVDKQTPSKSISKAMDEVEKKLGFEIPY